MLSILWTLSSCSCSTIGVEMHSKQVVGSSFSLFSFATFVFTAFVSLAERPQLLLNRRIPLRAYLQIVLIFFVVNLLNNRMLSFGLPFPLIIIFRSSTLITNVLLSWLLQNRTFSPRRLLSVFLVSVGIALFTLFSHHHHQSADGMGEMAVGGNDQKNSDRMLLISDGRRLNFVLDILVLSCSSFASAYLGIVQEKLFMRYGKHPEEMMFFVHFLSLPLFAFVANEIRSDFAVYSSNVSSAFLSVPLLSLSAILFLQLICVRSVYRLASETTSLKVSMTLALRKFLSILFSVIIFKNEFELGHAIATVCVLLGSFTFYDGFARLKTKIGKKNS